MVYGIKVGVGVGSVWGIRTTGRCRAIGVGSVQDIRTKRQCRVLG